MMSDRPSATTATVESEAPPTTRSLSELLSSTRVQMALLVAVTLFAALLRFYKLGAWSFWGDEMLTVAGVPDGFNYDLIRQSLAHTLIELAIRQLGVSEWSARLVPALVGVVSVPVLYLPTQKMFGAGVALLSALLLAISPWHLYWSQNARFYTLLLLFYTLALLAFYLALEEDRPLYLFLSLLFLGLAARERLLALFLVPVLGAYLLLLALLPVEKPAGFRRLRRLTLLLIPGLLLAAYFAWPYLRHLPDWFAGFGRINNSPAWLGAGVLYYMRLSTVCLATGGAVFLLARSGAPPRRRAGLLLSLSALLPILALMALAPFHYTANRYVFVTLTSWLILAAVAAVELLRHAAPDTRWLAAGAVLFLLLDPMGEDTLYYRYQNGNRDDWRAAFALVEARSADADQIVTPHDQLAEYYLGRRTVPFSQIDLAQIEGNRQTVWFVEDMTVAELYPQAYRWLRGEAELVAVFDVAVQARTFTMRVYRYPPASTSP
jgi:hypothetical protein